MTMWPVPWRFIAGSAASMPIEQSQDVDVDHRGVFSTGRVVERRGNADVGDVEQQVEGGELQSRTRSTMAEACASSVIISFNRGSTSPPASRIRAARSLRHLHAPRRDRHGRACCRERKRGRFADAREGAGHQGDLSVQSGRLHVRSPINNEVVFGSIEPSASSR